MKLILLVRKKNGVVQIVTPYKNLKELLKSENKKATHDAFDRIWMKKHCTREEAYGHLSNAIGIPINYTHIGMFNIKTCKKAINWANQVFSDLEIESEKTEELFEWMKIQRIKENDYNKINPRP